MKPQRFEIGQAVTPNKKNKWENVSGLPPKNNEIPVFGEVYRVKQYKDFYKGHWYMYLYEFDYEISYCEDSFDPVITTSQLEEELKEINAKVTI